MRKYLLILFIIPLLLALPHSVSAQQASSTAETLLAQINTLFLLIKDLQAQLVALKSEAASQPAIVVATTSIAVLSPNGGESFNQGQQIKISWSGGDGNVQIGLVDKKYETDKTVLGWISLKEMPDSSFTWDGKKVSDITGTVSQAVSSLSAGPFKIIAISDGLNKNYCVLPNSNCNYDLSNSYFTIIFPALSNSLSVSCAATVGTVQAGAVVTWEASAINGQSPYAYIWSGSDNISALPPRFSSDGKFLDVIYNATGLKTAGVTVRDAKGKEAFASCNMPVTIVPASSPITVLSPNGGESFVMTTTLDPSQFIKVSWRVKWPLGLRDEKVQIALLDDWGSVCNLGSVSRLNTEKFIGLVDGYACSGPGGNWVLSPGKYKVKVYLEGKETTMYDTSDSYFTLTAPALDVQAIIPSALVVKSGESLKFRFLYPPNAVKASLFLSCPLGITASTSNTCNKQTDISSYMASSTDYSATFSNSSLQAQTVAANYYVYLPNNPNYSRGVHTEITVLSASPSANSSIAVLAPNGGEKIHYGESFIYRFTANQAGQVDLTLVPYPPIDAGLVCQIASNISAGAGELYLAIPSTGSCTKGPAKTVAGSYKLFATLKDGETKLATDVSDSAFTITASSTVLQ